MSDQELSVPAVKPQVPPPSDANMTAEQKLYVLNALQVVGDWSVHDDGDGRLFYYDRKADSSQWKVPGDLASLETEFMMKLMLQNAVARSGSWTAHDAANGTLYYFNAKTRESVWERPREWGEAEAAATAEERERERMAEARKAQEEAEHQKEKAVRKEKKEKKKHKKHKKHTEKRFEEAEQKADEAKEENFAPEEVEEEVPLTAEELQVEEERKVREQKRIEQFRVMLRDKNIMPFCKWSVALPQIAGDPRFMGVQTMDERRAIFEHFIEHRREDLKAEKKSKLKPAKKLFTELLREQFQLDSWEPNTTLSVFLSTLETNIDAERYTQIQDDALALLTLSAQEKIYAKAVADYKSEALKRDGEQLRLTKFLEDKLSTCIQTQSTTLWESDEVQKLVREFYSSAASGGESAALLSEQMQKEVLAEVVARLARAGGSTQYEEDRKLSERSKSRRRSPSRERAQSSERKHRDSSLRRNSQDSHPHRHRSRSRRRNRSNSRSQSRGRERSHISRRSSRRRSASSSWSRSRSRSHSREGRLSQSSFRRYRHHSSSSSRSRSRARR